MEKKIILIVCLLAFTGCTHLPKKDIIEFSAGVLVALGAHQAGHIVAAEIKGYDWKLLWNSKIVPNEHTDAKRPDPFVYGAGIGLEILVDEIMFNLVKPEKRGSFWYGWIATSTWDQLNYCRRGTIGEGSTDLSRERFGGHHKVAGAVSGFHGAANVYRLAQDPKVKSKTKKWWEKIKIRFLMKGEVEAQFAF